MVIDDVSTFSIEKKKFCFTSLILFCIAIAATAGPSSANLLIARLGIWPQKPFYLAVNATLQDIWPNHLDGQNIRIDCKTMSLDSRESRLDCPLSMPSVNIGVQAFRVLLESSRSVPLIDERGRVVIKEFGLSTLDPRIVGTFKYAPCALDALGNPTLQSCGTFPQLSILKGFSYRGNDLQYFAENSLNSYKTIRKNYYQACSAVSCVADSVLNGSDQTAFRFARIAETASEV